MQIMKEQQKFLMHFISFIFLFSYIRNEAVHLSTYVNEWIEAGARWIGKFEFLFSSSSFELIFIITMH